MDPDLVIERETGALRLGERDRLEPWEKLQTVAPRVTDLVRHRQDFGTGYEWLYLQHLNFGGQPAHLGLCFAHGRLEMIQLNVSLPGAREGWPGKEEMDAEIAFIRNALEPMIGFDPARPAMTFPWGRAWCDYDPRSDTASGGLRYT